MEKLRIRELREAAELTQTDLARALGVSRPAVSLWESGAKRPMASRLPALAAILHCTIDELYGREAAS